MACGWSRCWKRSPPFSTTSGTSIECIRRSGAGPEAARRRSSRIDGDAVLRSLVLMRLKNWDYRELRERTDGLTLRQFTDFYCAAPVPKHGLPLAWLHPSDATDAAESSQRLSGSGGGRARIGGRCEAAGRRHGGGPTFIIRPTRRCWDVVRVVTRLVRRLAKALELRQIKGFCDRTRSARRRMYEIQRMTTRQRHGQQTHTYRVLIDIAEEVFSRKRTRGAREGPAPRCAARTCSPTWLSGSCAGRSSTSAGWEIVSSRRRRVLFGEQVATGEGIHLSSSPIPT